jgi:hypothetical protein
MTTPLPPPACPACGRPALPAGATDADLAAALVRLYLRALARGGRPVAAA